MLARIGSFSPYPSRASVHVRKLRSSPIKDMEGHQPLEWGTRVRFHHDIFHSTLVMKLNESISI